MQKRTTKRLVTGLGIAVFILSILYAVIVLTPWSVGLCGEEPIAEAYSPDGAKLARVFVRNCGATTGYLTHINLRSKWSYFNPTWVGTITQGQVFSNFCWSNTHVSWLDDSHLQIEYQSCVIDGHDRDPVHMKEEIWNGVHLSYVELKTEP